MTRLLIEKNMYKDKFNEIFPLANRFHLIKSTLKNPVNLNRFNQDLESI